MALSQSFWRSVAWLAGGGGVAFWVVNLGISLTPVAADYRAAVGISYLPMLLEAVAGGLIIGLCVSYGLVRFFPSIPTNSPISKSLVLALVALVVVTVVIEAPSKLLVPVTDAWRYFLIAGIFNALRIAALGLVVGWVFQRIQGRSATSTKG